MSLSVPVCPQLLSYFRRSSHICSRRFPDRHTLELDKNEYEVLALTFEPFVYCLMVTDPLLHKTRRQHPSSVLATLNRDQQNPLVLNCNQIIVGLVCTVLN